MCIIIYKDSEVGHPPDKVIQTCLKTHKDGFGVMWRHGEKVAIVKGLYTFKDIKAIINRIPEDSEAAFHFRMATHGGVKAGNCHPFPLTSRIDALEQTVGIFDTGLMHNGIIYDYGNRNSSVHSDTMNFIKHLEKVTNKTYTYTKLEKHMRDNYGKFVVFIPGWTYFFGTFLEEGGLKYSNTTYRDFSHNWGCNNPSKGITKADTYLNKPFRYENPLVVEVRKEMCSITSNFAGCKDVEYKGRYGRLLPYRGSFIFAEYGYYTYDLDQVKDEIDLAMSEGEYEGPPQPRLTS